MIDIIKNHPEYKFPNYCFTERFKMYYFFVPNLIYSDCVLFFNFLRSLQLNFARSHHDTWEMFAPKAGEMTFIKPGTEDIKEYFESIKIRGSLNDLKLKFDSFFIRYKQPFGTFYRIFWISYENKVQVYFDDDAEIVIVGVELEKNLIKLDRKIEENILRNFGYDGGFLEYANGYGKYLLELTDYQIANLNGIFTQKSN